MKKLLMIFVLAIITIVVNAQGIVQKLSADDFKVHKAMRFGGLTLNQDSLLTSINKWTLATGVTTVAMNLKTGEFSAFSSAGIGMVRSWYKLKSDKVTVYKTFSAGGMLLFGNTEQDPLFNTRHAINGFEIESPKTDIGVMGVVGIGAVSVGPTYFFVSRTLLLNLQATFTF